MFLDREHCRQCLVNIMDNAFQSINEKRENMIAADNEPSEDQPAVESVKTEERVETRITDTGTGIPPDHMDKICEPLFSTRGFVLGWVFPG
ncbi:MAG: ATP-binding protein [Thermodesulfobacteriota bacterium]|nr:ATP-binding protein [Thermodesulfobacteriota bacterium]